jgi:uncharacterized Fe-S radical SAM superfamily protein PflX
MNQLRIIIHLKILMECLLCTRKCDVGVKKDEEVELSSSMKSPLIALVLRI